ncbi:MAG: YicC/YloC family endoribonuclease [Pseudomonadota bacterium]
MKESKKENLRSMTGYAVESADLPAGQLSLELRAVNSRFLDLSFRMGEDFRVLEPALRERITERVKRGKLECRVNFTPREDAALPTALNTALLEQLRALVGAAREAFPDARPLAVAEVLRWPGMLGDNAPDMEQMQATALKLMDTVLGQFNASRNREGDKLKAVILDRVAGMREHVARIRPRTPEIVAAYREKLNKRLEELLPSPDAAERIHQEVALFAQKIDVDEELDRLLTHLDEVTRVLDNGGAAGKRLDFLMQELNREANTLGSKSVSLELTRTSVELKVLIEQIREQVQNIE